GTDQVDGRQQSGRRTRNVGHFSELCDQLTPIRDSWTGLLLLNIDMCCKAQEIALQSYTESVVDGKRHDKRHDASSHAKHRDRRNHRDNGLLTLGSQVSAGYKKLESGGHKVRNHTGGVLALPEVDLQKEIRYHNANAHLRLIRSLSLI